MKRTHQMVAASLILAAVAGVATLGCRSFSWGDSPGAAGAAGAEGAALASGEAGIKTIAAQTQVAEKQVQKARPHADVQGQAYLEAASDAHSAALATTGQVENSLQAARGEVQALRQQLDDAAAQLREGEKKLASLQQRWFVCWGERLERWFWTAAITWLTLSAASLLLGGGSPLGWLGKLRGALRPLSRVKEVV